MGNQSSQIMTEEERHIVKEMKRGRHPNCKKGVYVGFVSCSSWAHGHKLGKGCVFKPCVNCTNLWNQTK
jgi:hypothetical protein